jgi:endonuclease/exonuclease/phosphatase family metal-dependent hydrolase
MTIAKSDRALTVLSYNIHKGRSFFSRRKSWDVLRKLLFTVEPDIVFLQEFFREPETEQMLEKLSDHLWPHHAYGQNATSGSFHYGNAILSRNAIVKTENFNISTNLLEKRGVLYACIRPEGWGNIHLACTHLNLTHKGRHRQVSLMEGFLKEQGDFSEPLILAGDFNDWSSRLKSDIEGGLQVKEVRNPGSKTPVLTFPSVLPVLDLDKIYQRHFKVRFCQRIMNSTLMFQSDHLPLVAGLEFL